MNYLCRDQSLSLIQLVFEESVLIEKVKCFLCCFLNSNQKEAYAIETSTLFSNLGGTISLYFGLSIYSSVELIKLAIVKMRKLKYNMT